MSQINNVCVIPARAGSKGLKHKNISALVDGVTLLSWAVERALAADCFDYVVISSDSKEYLNSIERDDERLIFHKRSRAHSEDNATLALVAIETLDYLKELAIEARCVASLQCTSPFLTVSTIQRAIGDFLRFNATGLMTVTSVESSHPATCIDVKSVGTSKSLGPLKFRFDVPERYSRFPRQAREPLYRACGGLYVRTVKQARCYEGNGYSLGHRALCFPIDELEAFDINSKLDLQFARSLIAEDRKLIQVEKGEY